MSNIILSAGNGGYIAGLVIELLIIVAAGVFIFLTLSGKLGKKAVAVTDEGEAVEGADEAPEQEQAPVADEAVAPVAEQPESEPLMAEEVPVPVKKAKKQKKVAEAVEEQDGAEAAADEAVEPEAAPIPVPEKKEPVKRKIKIRLNIKGTDGSDILSQDVTPTENGGEEEAKIDLNVDDLTKAVDGAVKEEPEKEEEAKADAASEEKAEEESAKVKKGKRKK